LEWRKGERGVYEGKSIKIILTAGCKLICSSSIVKDKHKQSINSGRRKYEELFYKERGNEEGENR
jgi:hypothetical protein